MNIQMVYETKGVELTFVSRSVGSPFCGSSSLTVRSPGSELSGASRMLVVLLLADEDDVTMLGNDATPDILFGIDRDNGRIRERSAGRFH
jgi:hypothetical protein